MAVLYFHIPFCKRLCGYCDFMRSVKLSYMPQVAEQMHRELESQRGFLTDKTIRTIYFGGGTPSLLSPSEIERFISHAGEIFDTSAVEEITIEVNPDDITESYVAELRKSSVNRVSMGVQSFDDNCLRFMGRRHSAEQAVTAIKRLREGGIENISVDIIFGVSGFGDKSLENTLQQVIAADVEHISAYHLTIEPQTRFGRLLAKGEMEQIPEPQSEAEFLLVHNTLTEAGFEHYEVSNYARPGYRSRHNSSYWTGVEYLGIGPGAHSYTDGRRRWCEQSVEQYIAGVEYGEEYLTQTDTLNEYVMVSLRRAEGIDLQIIAQRWSEAEAERISAAAEQFIATGRMVREQNTIRIVPQHFLVSDAVITELFA